MSYAAAVKNGKKKEDSEERKDKKIVFYGDILISKAAFKKT